MRPPAGRSPGSPAPPPGRVPDASAEAPGGTVGAATGADGATGAGGAAAGAAGAGDAGLGPAAGSASGSVPKSGGRAPSTLGTSWVPTRSATRSSSVTFGARTTRGVIEMRTSVSSFWRRRSPKSLPMIGMLFIPMAPANELASRPCRRPPMRPVSPSRRRRTPVTLRVKKVGTLIGLLSLPTLRSSPSRLNSAASSRVTSPLAATRGVRLRFTPTFLYVKLVAGR